jgi:hypothetical protein
MVWCPEVSALVSDHLKHTNTNMVTKNMELNMHMRGNYEIGYNLSLTKLAKQLVVHTFSLSALVSDHLKHTNTNMVTENMELNMHMRGNYEIGYNLSLTKLAKQLVVYTFSLSKRLGRELFTFVTLYISR